MAYKKFGIAGAVVAALSLIGIKHTPAAALPLEAKVVHGNPGRPKRNTPVLRFRVRSRKTMTVPQMKRVAKKRRNMAKRGQK